MENKSTTRMGSDNCPNCNYHIDSATSLNGDHVPSPKDLTVCLKCAEVLYYEDDMKLGLFPKILFEDLPDEIKTTLIKVQTAIKQITK